MNNMTQTKPIESSIRKKLKESFDPYFIDVVNESYMHNVPKGSETHFKVVVVSEQFDNKPLIMVSILHYIFKKKNNILMSMGRSKENLLTHYSPDIKI